VRFRALATDYDGTLATHGAVYPQTVAALRQLRDAGRRLLLVTGRELPDLKRVFPEYQTFDVIVAENGALLFNPSTNKETLLCEGADETLVERLREMDVPISVGRAVVATTEPYYQLALSAIHDLGLELQLTFNKGSVMVLPSGVNKATGLAPALQGLGIDAREVVAVGDAENDHAFLAACGCGVAVANALPSLKSRAQVVTRGTHGDGVAEVIREMIADDFARCARCGGAG